MKVALIAFNNIKYSPYVRTYSDFFDKNGVDYDVILPNRNGFDEKLGSETYAIKWDKKKSKLKNFIYFAKSTKKIINKNKYDFLVVLTTMPAVLLSGFLTKKYKNRYIVDVRDYTYENIGFYYKLEKSVLKYAKMRVISSSGFKKFLPEFEYSLCHNTSYNFANSKPEFVKKEGEPITIGYVGSVSYANRCKHMIDLVDKDSRFNFYFYGNETKGSEISDYVKSKNNERIKFFGAYSPDEKSNIIEGVDILFNVYGNGTPLVKYAVSNKLYDSFYFKKPLLTSSNTIMSELAGDFSFDIEPSDTELDRLYEWYNSIEERKIVEYINLCLNDYSQDIYDFNASLEKIFIK